MVLEVPLPAWNDIAISAIVFGLDISPDRPGDHGPTTVEICGSWEKLQQAYNYSRRKVDSPKLVCVAGSLPLDGIQ